MKINWKDLKAAKAAEPYMEILLNEDPGQQASGMEQYTVLPEEVQCALGYMRCLMESSASGTYSAYGRYAMDMFRHNLGHIPLMRLPLRFIGWGGEHNEIGPAYEIDSKCYNGSESRIFYTDEDICGNAEYSEKLAGYIAQRSSGIAEIRAEKLEVLRTMNREERKAHWCVTFTLDGTTVHEIFVNGKQMTPEAGKAFFLLPKAGEFDCMLGEIVDGDPDNAFILAKHSYCMK